VQLGGGGREAAAPVDRVTTASASRVMRIIQKY
jgi:hypothetical protein